MPEYVWPEDPAVQQVIDPEKLAAADPRVLRDLMLHAGWTEYLQPLLIGLMTGWMAQLADPDMKRYWKKPDDYLRGGIAACRAILNYPAATLDNQNRREAEREKEEAAGRRYDDVALGGRGPFGEDQIGLSPSDPV